MCPAPTSSPDSWEAAEFRTFRCDLAVVLEGERIGLRLLMVPEEAAKAEDMCSNHVHDYTGVHLVDRLFHGRCLD